MFVLYCFLCLFILPLYKILILILLVNAYEYENCFNAELV